jgi:hypothetical protein
MVVNVRHHRVEGYKILAMQIRHAENIRDVPARVDAAQHLTVNCVASGSE